MFRDRRDAGRRLAESVRSVLGGELPAGPVPVVAALVRGGVPVAVEVAGELAAPLEILVVRKVGAPSNPEFGIGAVSESGRTVANPRALEYARVDASRFERLAEAERAEVARRVSRYRGDRDRVPFERRTVVIVDDGVATGVSARVAVDTARDFGASRVVLAVPVGAADTVRDFEGRVDDVVCLATPPDFRAVGSWYGDFRQVTDDEVVAALGRADDDPGGDG